MSPHAGHNRPAAHTPHWSEDQERSSAVALRVMAAVAVGLGRSAARVLLVPIAGYFLLFAPGPRRNSARFLERALGRAPTWGERFKHIHTFACVVLDRLYFVRGQMGRFEMHLHGTEHVDAQLDAGGGVFLLGAHLGSFEALHAVGEGRPDMKVAMVMYPDNARKIHAVLRSVAPQFDLGIIAIGRPGSTLAIREWLAGNGLVGLLGDRFLPGQAGTAGTVQLPFLGRDAPFADGPLRLAQVLRQRVLFMVALYHGGKRYEVHFEPLCDFSQPVADAAERARQLHDALSRYAQRLEALARAAPFNWFNFHDFWHEDAAS